MERQPKNTKYRKAFKGRNRGIASNGFTLAFGDYGLKAISPERVTAKQIEACRKAINRHRKRYGKLWIRIFPHLPVSKKPADVRMGSGKGNVEFYAARVKPGKILFELSGIPKSVAKGALERAAAKLPLKTKFVSVFDADDQE